MVGEQIAVAFDLKNTGKVAGEEVAQLYLSTGKIVPNLPMAEKQLRGFKKIRLNPGESCKTTFLLTPEELYIYNEESTSYQVPEGEYIVRIGGASDHLPLQSGFTLIPAKGKPELTVKNIRTLPAFPKVGDEVTFLASIINNGTSATRVGDDHIIKFFMDGEEVAVYRSNSLAIPVGGMNLVCSQGLRGKNWMARNGQFKVSATIETTSDELNKYNNHTEAQLTIPNGKVIPSEIAKLLEF